LERDAVKLSVVADDSVVASVEGDEASFFVPVDGSKALTEHTADVYVTIMTAVLEGRTKWKFNDGRATFSALIEDKTFLARVDKGSERFGKGDTLLVRLRSMQKRRNGQLLVEHVVEEVLDHIAVEDAQGQLDLRPQSAE